MNKRGDELYLLRREIHDLQLKLFVHQIVLSVVIVLFTIIVCLSWGRHV
jgi:hypothetical protein